MRSLFRRPVTWILLVVVAAGAAVGLALFEPWRLFTSSHLDEPAPVALESSTPSSSDQPSSDPAQPSSADPAPAPAEPVVLARGSFVSQEHDTRGTATVLELPGGERFLRVEGFATSDGPDLHVWLSDATAGGEWSKYDDGRYVALGEMKATQGNHNYAIPADADLAGLNSVVIWCDRFNVAFGSAELEL